MRKRKNEAITGNASPFGKNSVGQKSVLAIFTTVCACVRMLSARNERVRIVVKLCHTFYIAIFFWSFVCMFVAIFQLDEMLLSNGDENCVTKSKFSPLLLSYKIRFFPVITFVNYAANENNKKNKF